MSKGLEALERVQYNYVNVFKARENGKTQLVHDLNAIKKELKALEIIVKHDVDIEYFKSCLKMENPLEVYNDRYDRVSVLDGDLHYRQLTEEKYVLLKEVLL